jgi:hypothetical protein
MAGSNPAGAGDGGGYLVEESQRVSESMMFRLQRQFYELRGQGAWDTGIVPSYITNSPYIARSYAEVVLGYLRDLRRLGREGGLDPGRPIHIVELAAGSGRFGFLFLKALADLQDDPALGGLTLRYVLTDFTRTNLEAWRAHPLREPFLASGALELGLFDRTADREIRLEGGRVLSADTLGNPLVVLANYAFDVLPQDVFRIEGGRLHEVRVTLRHRRPSVPDLADPDVLMALDATFDKHEVEEGYYGDAELDRILGGYRARLADTTIPMPVAAFRGLRSLIDMARGRLLVLASDKAYAHEDQLAGLPAQPFQLHGGSFSMMVNFHAMAQLFEGRGGLAAATSQRHLGLQTVALCLGGDAAALAGTSRAFRGHLDELGPYDVCGLLAHQGRACKSIGLEHFLQLLRLSRWDPMVVHELGKDALEEAHDAPEPLRRELGLSLERVFDRFYPMGRDLPFELARFSLALRRPRDAIRYGEASLALFGEHAVTYANLGVAHHYAGDPAAALACFDRSIAHADGYATPREWRQRVLAGGS